MEKRIFLTGPTGCGKSSMLRRVLGESLSAAGGLVTERAMDEQGGFLGYELLPAASLGGVQGYRGELYLDCRSFPPAHDTEVFRTAGKGNILDCITRVYGRDLARDLVPVDAARDGHSGATYEDLAAFMAEQGCTQAYNLDGGNSALMVFNGENYSDKSFNAERSVSDIIYFSTLVDYGLDGDLP